ncbi:MAG TPA: hypothetical protein VHR66_24315 [Gemmataceae bacterium]|nr:hypothetical protein [Gemmataceae bacterium]
MTHDRLDQLDDYICKIGDALFQRAEDEGREEFDQFTAEEKAEAALLKDLYKLVLVAKARVRRNTFTPDKALGPVS